MIVETNKEKYRIGKDLSIVTPEREYKKFAQYFKPGVTYSDNVKSELVKEISEESIKRALSNVKILILELTQNCNLRCKYCIFGGDYTLRRAHQPKTMTSDTARKGIDFFLEQIDSPLRTLKDRDINISFYGGEALLEFDTLIEAVRYIKTYPNRRNFDFAFSLTSNGILLTPEKVRILANENIRVDISLDGPAEEHNNFRVMANGTGSWQHIMKNIKYIKNEYPAYFENKIRFFVTLHPQHDIQKIERFFLGHSDFFNENRVVINNVSIDDLEDTEKQAMLKKTWENQIDRIYSELEKDKWFYRKIALDDLQTRLMPFTSLRSKTRMFTGACFPGGLRHYIDVDGQFHICEQMNGKFPIGNLKDGYDIKAIKTILENWRKEILKSKCWTCNHWYLCGFCFSNTGRDGEFRIPKKTCKKLEKNMPKRFYRYLSFKEKEDEKNDYYNDSNIPDFLAVL